MRRLFLQLALIDVLAVIALGTLGVLYHGKVHMAGNVAVGAVLAVFFAAAGYALWMAWHGRGDLRHVEFGVAVCPMLSMLGTVAGFLIAFSGDSGDVQERVLGASTGLASTFVGVSCAIVLMLQAHMLRGPRAGCCK